MILFTFRHSTRSLGARIIQKVQVVLPSRWEGESDVARHPSDAQGQQESR